jgi:hypothetical protein
MVDLLLTYDWPYDEPFVGLLSQTFNRAGRSLVAVSPPRLSATLLDLQAGRLKPRAYLDRASDTTPDFQPLDDWAQRHIPVQLNPGERRRQIWHKTNLHWDFIAAGIHTPYTIAIPAWRRHPLLEPPADLAALGVPFSIKPDLGGGGWGVVVDARSWEDVLRARERLPEENLILQQFVEPTVLGGRRAWFRILYACGLVAPCWWDDQTRLFGPAVTPEERVHWGLDPLWEIVATAARVAGLALFSTEIARVADGRFIVVDYVNDPVDLRFLPHAREGMPAETARAVAQAITNYLV